jgi:hypothetical protein
VASTGIDAVCVPTFADIEIDGERRTAIRLRIEDRARTAGAPALNGHGATTTRATPPPRTAQHPGEVLAPSIGVSPPELSPPT